MYINHVQHVTRDGRDRSSPLLQSSSMQNLDSLTPESTTSSGFLADHASFSISFSISFPLFPFFFPFFGRKTIKFPHRKGVIGGGPCVAACVFPPFDGIVAYELFGAAPRGRITSGQTRDATMGTSLSGPAALPTRPPARSCWTGEATRSGWILDGDRPWMSYLRERLYHLLARERQRHVWGRLLSHGMQIHPTLPAAEDKGELTGTFESIWRSHL